MIEIDLDALEKAARAATSGPWVQEGYYNTCICTVNELIAECPAIKTASYDGIVNTAFIAAANPATVLALIERLRQAEKQYGKEGLPWPTEDGWWWVRANWRTECHSILMLPDDQIQMYGRRFEKSEVCADGWQFMRATPPKFKGDQS